MRPPQYDFAIGSAWNMPLNALTNVEAIVDSNGIPLYPPSSYGSYSPGSPATRGNGVQYQRGFEDLNWDWTGNGGKGYISYDGALTIRNDFFGGNWSGTCSIYSTAGETSSDYKLYNAIGTIKKLPESTANFKALNTFGIKFTRLVERDE